MLDTKLQLEQNKLLVEAIKRDFNNPVELNKAIDIDAYENLSLTEVQQIPELSNFFGLDEKGPYSEFLKKGLKSLRQGFYKLCSSPNYNTTINPHTFSADVYYFYNDNSSFNNIIKYRANIGPRLNAHFFYHPVYGTPNDSEIQLLQTFYNQKRLIGTFENHYYQPKENFFTDLYDSGKLFYVINSEFGPAIPNEPRPKKVTWSFLDF